MNWIELNVHTYSTQTVYTQYYGYNVRTYAIWIKSSSLAKIERWLLCNIYITIALKHFDFNLKGIIFIKLFCVYCYTSSCCCCFCVHILQQIEANNANPFFRKMKTKEEKQNAYSLHALYKIKQSGTRHRIATGPHLISKNEKKNKK